VCFINIFLSLLFLAIDLFRLLTTVRCCWFSFKRLFSKPSKLYFFIIYEWFRLVASIVIPREDLDQSKYNCKNCIVFLLLLLYMLMSSNNLYKTYYKCRNECMRMYRPNLKSQQDWNCVLVTHLLIYYNYMRLGRQSKEMKCLFRVAGLVRLSDKYNVDN